MPVPISRSELHPSGHLRPGGGVPASGRIDPWPREREAQGEAYPLVARRRLPSGGPPASPNEFQLTEERSAATFILRIAGEFDIAGVGRVELTLDNALRAAPRHVVLDLSDVTFLDMAGLMTLIRADECARHAAYDVQVVAPTGLASRVFTLTRAGEQLTMLEPNTTKGRLSAAPRHSF